MPSPVDARGYNSHLHCILTYMGISATLPSSTLFKPNLLSTCPCQLTLNISNLPEFQNSAAYKCKFSAISTDSSSSGSSAQVTSYSTEAKRDRDNFQCYTPPKAELPPFETGSGEYSIYLYLKMAFNIPLGVSYSACRVKDSCALSSIQKYWEGTLRAICNGTYFIPCPCVDCLYDLFFLLPPLSIGRSVNAFKTASVLNSNVIVNVLVRLKNWAKLQPMAC